MIKKIFRRAIGMIIAFVVVGIFWGDSTPGNPFTAFKYATGFTKRPPLVIKTSPSIKGYLADHNSFIVFIGDSRDNWVNLFKRNLEKHLIEKQLSIYYIDLSKNVLKYNDPNEYVRRMLGTEATNPPAIYLVKNGKVVDRLGGGVNGQRDLQNIKKFFDKYGDFATKIE